MIKFIDSILSKFKNCFSRSATYRWFVLVVTGFFMRTEFLGVTSFMRCFSLAPKAYDSLIKFFRSDAYSSDTLRKKWYGIINERASLYQLNVKNLLAGDGTKHPKEGARMPGGFCYHFWSKAMPKLKCYRKAGEPSGLSQVENQCEQKLISNTIKAIKRFVLFTCISMRIIQLMAQTPAIADKAKKSRYLRSYSESHVSETTVIEYMHKHFFRLLLSSHERI